MPKNFLKRILRSRLFLVVSLCFLILAALSLFKIIAKRIEVNREIASLEKKIRDLEDHNLELTKLVDYFESNDFREREARLELGMKKIDERVVVFPQVKPTSTDAVVEVLKEKIEDEFQDDNFESKSENNNIIKWWQYFFSPDKK